MRHGLDLEHLQTNRVHVGGVPLRGLGCAQPVPTTCLGVTTWRVAEVTGSSGSSSVWTQSSESICSSERRLPAYTWLQPLQRTRCNRVCAVFCTPGAFRCACKPWNTQ